MNTTVPAPAPRAATAARGAGDDTGRAGDDTGRAGDDTGRAGDDAGRRPPAADAAGTRPGPQGRPGPEAGLKALSGLASVALNLGGPLLAYKLIRPDVSSSAMALALSGAIPVVYTLVILAVQRRLSTLGMIGVVLYGLGVLLSWASGGNTLALELQDPVVTGLFGLACLGSVAVRRPLHRVILRLMGRSNPHYAEVANRVPIRTSMITTAILGLAFLSHAIAVAVLALTQSTSTFVNLQQPVGLPFLAVGIGGLFLYGSRQQGRQRAAAAAEAGAGAGAEPEADAGQQGEQA